MLQHGTEDGSYPYDRGNEPERTSHASDNGLTDFCQSCSLFGINEGGPYRDEDRDDNQRQERLQLES